MTDRKRGEVEEQKKWEQQLPIQEQETEKNLQELQRRWTAETPLPVLNRRVEYAENTRKKKRRDNSNLYEV